MSTVMGPRTFMRGKASAETSWRNTIRYFNGATRLCAWRGCCRDSTVHVYRAAMEPRVFARGFTAYCVYLLPVPRTAMGPRTVVRGMSLVRYRGDGAVRASMGSACEKHAASKPRNPWRGQAGSYFNMATPVCAWMVVAVGDEGVLDYVMWFGILCSGIEGECLNTIWRG